MEANQIERYFQEHRGEHLEELESFLRIPSVSSLSEHKQDMLTAAEWLVKAFEKAGLENVKIDETGGHL